MNRTIQTSYQAAFALHQQGRLQEAAQIYRAVLDQSPQHADALHMLGVIALQGGHYLQAAMLLQKAVVMAEPVALHQLNWGVALRELGHPRSAELAYHHAARLNPLLAEAYNNLGLLLEAGGRATEAVHAYRAAQIVRPSFVDPLHNLGLALQSSARFDEAREQHLRALRLQPDYFIAHNGYGTALDALGNFSEARHAFSHTLCLQPALAVAHNNLGKISLSLDALEDAVKAFRRALHLGADQAAIHRNLAKTLFALDRPGEATPYFRRAILLDPADSEAWAGAANGWRTLHWTDQATACYRRAKILKPDGAEIHTNLAGCELDYEMVAESGLSGLRAVSLAPGLGGAYKSLGDNRQVDGKFDEADQFYRRAIQLEPENFNYYLSLTANRKFIAGDPVQEFLEQAATHPQELTAQDQVFVHFSLAKIHSDIGERDLGFNDLLLGNRKRRALEGYDEAAMMEKFDRALRYFRPGSLDHCHLAAPTGPIFILGMPRSGSSLIEQILTSHPMVGGAGESPFLVSAVERYLGADGYPDALGQCSPLTLDALGSAYLTELRHKGGNRPRLTDKTPLNFFYCGLIPQILPDARIIHTKRSAVETCLSCFSKLFRRGQDYSYDLLELGRFYRRYEELMAHWSVTLPANLMLDVHYEGVVDNLEGEARKMLEFLGLPWDDKCLDFHRNDRPVRTASVTQVRQPIYRSSVRAWRPEPTLLQPLLEGLTGG